LWTKVNDEYTAPPIPPFSSADFPETFQTCPHPRFWKELKSETEFGAMISTARFWEACGERQTSIATKRRFKEGIIEKICHALSFAIRGKIFIILVPTIQHTW
jgi:hypothetical protein